MMFGKRGSVTLTEQKPDAKSAVNSNVEGYKSVVLALTNQLEAALERERWLHSRLEVERERAVLAQRLLPLGNRGKKSHHVRRGGGGCSANCISLLSKVLLSRPQHQQSLSPV